MLLLIIIKTFRIAHFELFLLFCFSLFRFYRLKFHFFIYNIHINEQHVKMIALSGKTISSNEIALFIYKIRNRVDSNSICKSQKSCNCNKNIFKDSNRFNSVLKIKYETTSLFLSLIFVEILLFNSIISD